VLFVAAAAAGKHQESINNHNTAEQAQLRQPV
jgi:hypothetical protein